MVNVLDDITKGFSFANDLRNVMERTKDREREEAAFNALQGQFGAVAGDPERQALLMRNQRDAERAPFEQRNLVAQTGQNEAQAAATQRELANQAARRGLTYFRAQVRGGVDPQEALSVTRQFALSQGLPEADTDQVLGVLASRPEAVDAILAALGDSGEESADYFIGQPIAAIGPDGKPVFIGTRRQSGIVPFEGYAPPAVEQTDQRLSQAQQRIDLARNAQSADTTFQQALGRTLGSEVAKTLVSLPQARIATQQVLESIDRIVQQPGDLAAAGFGNIGGWLQQQLPISQLATGAGDVMAEIQRLNGQIFLQQYQTLRGAGAITNMEGETAVKALLNPSPNLTPQQFINQLSITRRYIKEMQDSLEAKARIDATGTVQQRTTAPAQGTAPSQPRTVPAPRATPNRSRVDELLSKYQ